MTIYTVAIGKGGTGKSTTAAELAAALGRGGVRTLAIDTDEQGNLTTRLGLGRDAEVGGDAAGVILGQVSIEDAATPAPSAPGVDVLAGTHALRQVESLPDVLGILPTLTAEQIGPGRRWAAAVIDTPPSLGNLTLAALAAAQVIVAPVECKPEAYEQVFRLRDVVTSRVARMRRGAEIAAVVPTMYDRRRTVDREVVELLGEHFGALVTPPVRQGVAAADAYTARQPVASYAPRSGVAQDYAAALAPILARAVEPH